MCIRDSNNSGGLAGNSKFQFEPSSGKVELDGTLDANTLSSASIVAEDVVVSNYLKLPNKTPSERDNLVYRMVLLFIIVVLRQ